MLVFHIVENNIHFEVRTNRKILFQDFPFFDDWRLAIMKMCSMFIGEVDFGSLYQQAVKGQGSSSWLSSLIYLSFVFMVVIVLMNLLNGLAVSDVGIIKAKADIDSSLARLEIIAEIESIRHR